MCHLPSPFSLLILQGQSATRPGVFRFPVHLSLLPLPMPRDLSTSSSPLTLIPTKSVSHILLCRTVGFCVPCPVPCCFPDFCQRRYGSVHRCLEADVQTEKLHPFECKMSCHLTSGSSSVPEVSSSFLLKLRFSVTIVWWQFTRCVMLCQLCMSQGFLVFHSKVLVLLVLKCGTNSWWSDEICHH